MNLNQRRSGKQTPKSGFRTWWEKFSHKPDADDAVAAAGAFDLAPNLIKKTAELLGQFGILDGDPLDVQQAGMIGIGTTTFCGPFVGVAVASLVLACKLRRKRDADEKDKKIDAILEHVRALRREAFLEKLGEADAKELEARLTALEEQEADNPEIDKVATPEWIDRFESTLSEILSTVTKIADDTENIEKGVKRIEEKIDDLVPTPKHLFSFENPSPKFAGREEQLSELLTKLKTGHTAHLTQPIAGMGGMGKSQIARKFARRCEERCEGYLQYRCIQEVNGASEAALLQSLAQVVKNLGLIEQEAQIPPEHLKPLVEKALACQQPWLLYVDSLDEPESARPEVVIDGKKKRIDVLPRASGGTILISSRQDLLPAWLAAGTPISVPVFPADVSVQILLDRAIPPGREPTRAEREAAAAIAEKLLHYPLSIEQAASYCSRQLAQTTLARYLDLLNRTDGELPPDHDHGLTKYERTARWTMSLALEKISTEARELLSFMAWIAPSPAPARMLAEVLRAKGVALADGDDWEALGPLRESLRGQGLLDAVDVERQTLSLHAVSGAAWRSLLSANHRPEELETWMEALRKAIPPVDAESALGLGDWIGHGAQMLGFAAALGIKKAVQGNLGNAFGVACIYLGRYGEAEPPLIDALRLNREVLGELDPFTINSMNNLAGLYNATGLYREAEPLYVESLTLRREVLGDRHPDTIGSMSNLAMLYQDRGRYVEAESLYLDALRLRQEVLGERHPDTAGSMNNLAGLYYTTGRYGEAEPLLVEALRLSCEVQGERHPYTIQTMDNLAGLYDAMGRYEEAEPLLVDTLRLQIEVLGGRHPRTITSMNNLGHLYQSTGRYGKAAPLFAEALGLRREVLGERHPDTIGSMNNLAWLYQIVGQYQEAEPLCDGALRLSGEVLGQRHPDTITTMNNRAGLYYATGRYEEAEPLYVETLKLRREVLGERHPDTIGSMNNLGLLYYATDRYGEAEPLYVDALRLRREVLGERHPDTIMSMNDLAMMYRATGRYGEAEPLLLEALKLQSEVLGERHPGTIGGFYNLAVFWIERGNPQGRGLFCEAYRLSRALPERHPVRLGVESWVEGLNLDCGEPEG